MTSHKDTNGSDANTDAWELVPWYVNGTLGAADRQLVETAAEADPALAAEIRQQRRVAETLADLDAMDEAEKNSWAALSAKLGVEDRGGEAEPEATEAGVFVPGANPAPETAPVATVTHLDTARRKRQESETVGEGLVTAGPTPWRLNVQRMRKVSIAAGIAAPALLAATIMAGLFWDPGSDQGAGFETLTSGSSTSATVLRLRTNDTLGATELRTAAEELGLRVLDGPSAGGVYTLAPVAGTDPQAAAEALGGMSGVTFVVVRVGTE